MSSLDSDDVRRRVQAAGAAGFLSKMTLGPEDIRKAITSLLETPGAFAPAATQTRIVAPDPGAFDPLAVASRLAHDANSWLTNAMFRLAAIRVDAEAAGAGPTLEHVEAIDTSLQALGDAVRGSRALILDEFAPVDPRPLALADVLPPIINAGPIGNAMGEVHGDGPAVLADVGALATLVTIVLDNASRAAGKGPCTVRFAIEGHSLGISDDGGPWAVSHPDRLGTCGFRGQPDSRQPGNRPVPCPAADGAHGRGPRDPSPGPTPPGPSPVPTLRSLPG